AALRARRHFRTDRSAVRRGHHVGARLDHLLDRLHHLSLSVVPRGGCPRSGIHAKARRSDEMIDEVVVAPGVSSTLAGEGQGGRISVLADYLSLTKPRILLLLLITEL